MKKYFLVSYFAFVGFSFAQTDIKSEDVTVEFSFNPTLTDVFKLKNNPEVLDSISKKKQSYYIQPGIVSSDYIPVPKKSSYATVDDVVMKPYNNWIYAGAGVYGNTELTSQWMLAEKVKLIRGVQIENHTTQNGVPNLKTKNNYINTQFNLFLGNNSKKLDWNTKINYAYKGINWYGIDNTALPTNYANVNVGQKYKGLNIGTTLDFHNKTWLNLQPIFNFFSDDYQSNESMILLNSDLRFKIGKKLINSTASVNVLNGSFATSYNTPSTINYSFMNLLWKPSMVFQKDKLTTFASLGLGFSSDKELGKTDFLLLPNITVTYPIIKDVMNIKGGIDSNFKQNTYQDFSNQNPYLTPNLNIKATTTPIAGFFSINGTLSSVFNYYVDANYAHVNNQALFYQNSVEPIPTKPYQFGNSYAITYRDFNILKTSGLLEALVHKNVTIGANAIFYQYSLGKQAWNLPNWETDGYVTFDKNKWNVVTAANIIGRRNNFNGTSTFAIPAFVDLSLKGKYEINKRLNAHLNLYNILASNYQLYNNYQVQGFQAIAGMTFKF